MSADNDLSKPKIAFFEFSSCEGCQLTVIDALQDHPDLLEAVEIVQFREAMSEKFDDYQIAFVEGSCTRPGDEPRLHAIREHARIVVALGACAHIGGVNAIRNRQSLDEVRRYVYGDQARLDESYTARPLEAVIPVDACIPGCPISREEFVGAVKALLQGYKPTVPDSPVCVECKLRETVCILGQGGVCLGPVTRAGCGAICPSFGSGCIGCRGLIPHANLHWLRAAMDERGIARDEADSWFELFLTYPMMENERAEYERR